ncbi:MAG TPA: hypothetical protein VGG14_16605 [Candidatus Sulfotelmatobacter sp.]|jgi:hypothetical protein
MTFDWTAATLLRKFAAKEKLDEEKCVTGNLVCSVCSFNFNDYSVVKGTRIPNVRREVTGKNRTGYKLVCGHTVNGLLRFWEDEFVSDTDLGASMESLGVR